MSNLESLARWIFDTLGVALGILEELEACRPGCLALVSPGEERTALTDNRPAQAHSWKDKSGTRVVSGADVADSSSEEERDVSSVESEHESSSCTLSGGDDVDHWIRSGLLEEAAWFSVVHFRIKTNGDDDWATCPLLTGLTREGDDLWDLMTTEGRNEVRSRKALGAAEADGVGQCIASRILDEGAMDRRAQALGLPVRLNKDKGSVGSDSAGYFMNSCRPVEFVASGRTSFYNPTFSPEQNFLGLTHPDRCVQRPEHSALRIAGAVLLNPSPDAYDIFRRLYVRVVETDKVRTQEISGSLKRKEKNNILYHATTSGAEDLVFGDHEDRGMTMVKMPRYSEVLSLHGFLEEADYMKRIEELAGEGTPRDLGACWGELWVRLHDGTLVPPSPMQGVDAWNEGWLEREGTNALRMRPVGATEGPLAAHLC